MNATDYQTAAARTLISAPETPFTSDELQIMLGAIDLCVKAGKVAEYVKKAICHRHGFTMLELSKKLVDVSRSTTDLMNVDITPAPDLIVSGNEQMILWCALGLAGEAGEVAESAAMVAQFDLFDPADLAKELGDQQWYAAALCTLAGIDLSGVMIDNIAKLKARYPNGYSSADSQARVDTKPRSDTLPIGTRATCQACGKPIEWIDPYWRHYGMGDNQPRHPAFPVEYAL